MNGTAFPVLRVKRRKYRLRFLDASVSRIYNRVHDVQERSGRAATSSYTGDELRASTASPTASAA